MKKSGCRTMLHVYLIFALAALGTVLVAGVFFYLSITVRQPGGAVVRSDWPRTFTAEFEEQIRFNGAAPKVTRAGLALLRENGLGLQILDPSGQEIYRYGLTEQARERYSGVELLRLYQDGGPADARTTAFVGAASRGEEAYAYILYFPMEISKVTMYLNGERFAGGKAAILASLGALCLLVLASGVCYGLLTARAMKRLTASVGEISQRSYLPVRERGAFRELHESLNALDAEIKAGDRIRRQTERMRKEWIANITHDLKTPLSSIRGYGEVLLENGGGDRRQCRRYAAVLLKNAAYMERLIDDMKLTYQLESGMVPIRRREQDAVRFLKELIIDILNAPEFENRIVRFERPAETLQFSFDETLLARALRNLVVNAFVHGEAETEVAVSLAQSGGALQICVADTGRGMGPEECEHLFDRYYRGSGTDRKPEGTGLGLAIAKHIVELHGGKISVCSSPGAGAAFQIALPPS